MPPRHVYMSPYATHSVYSPNVLPNFMLNSQSSSSLTPTIENRRYSKIFLDYRAKSVSNKITPTPTDYYPPLS